MPPDHVPWPRRAAHLPAAAATLALPSGVLTSDLSLPCRLAGTMPELTGCRLTPREPPRGAGVPTRGWR